MIEFFGEALSHVCSQTSSSGLSRARNAARDRATALIVARPEALVRTAALYRMEDVIRGKDPDLRPALRQEQSRPLVDAFFECLAAQAARPSHKKKEHIRDSQRT
jgi:hypothetical protein